MTKPTGRIKRRKYWAIKMWEHPFCDSQGYIFEHRLVMEKMIGRYLAKEEAVHHVNHDPGDNRPENLELFATHGMHTKLRHPEVMLKLIAANTGRRPPNYNRGIKNCPICNAEFETTLSNSRAARKTCGNRACITALRKRSAPSEKQLASLKLGHGWNKGQPLTWAKKGKDSPSYKHGRYSKYI